MHIIQPIFSISPDVFEPMHTHESVTYCGPRYCFSVFFAFKFRICFFVSMDKCWDHTALVPITYSFIALPQNYSELQAGYIVYSSVMFHINSDRSALCLYTVTGWGVMSGVCGMAFLCGSTLVKVSLLQAGTVVIWPHMFQSDIKPKHTALMAS